MAPHIDLMFVSAGFLSPQLDARTSNITRLVLRSPAVCFPKNVFKTHWSNSKWLEEMPSPSVLAMSDS